MSLPLFYQRYVDRIITIEEGLQISEQALLEVVSSLSDKDMMYAYDENKWTIKQVIQHINDTERILSYRLLCFAREEKQNLLSFEEDEYVVNSRANTRTKEALLKEFKAVRQSTRTLVESLELKDYNKRGKANDIEMSVEDMIKIICGHVLHHVTVIEDKYFKRM
ncbi:hypothetical protein UJ101_00067 [Flavobacteriaceae bacterium UJ101]|nr:hypothetical protein UJ101_00067 [Flavobacteriaceae bacterium UJ101]